MLIMLYEVTYGDIIHKLDDHGKICYHNIEASLVDSLARYKRAIESNYSYVTVSIIVDRDGEYIDGFTIEMIFSGLRTRRIRIEFNDIRNSAVYCHYFNGDFELQSDKDGSSYHYLGSAIWAGCFNKCLKALDMHESFFVGLAFYGFYCGIGVCEDNNAWRC